MSTLAAYITLTALALTFSLILAVVTFRFLAVIQQIKRSDSLERAELLREVDQAHAVAFANAMTALQQVQERVVSSQSAMFNSTMDMVHGPQRTDEPTDDAAFKPLDNRAVWEDDEPVELSMIDPTDTDMWFGIDVSDHDPSAVSVRPGETLVP